MSATIVITENATAGLAQLRAGLEPAKLYARIAPAALRLMQDHLTKLESAGNKNGWPSLHFWAQCARSLTGLSDANGAYVNVNHVGFRQRLQGGVVKPVDAKMLAIPARAEAYGKRAREFGNLKLVFGKRSDGTVGPVGLAAGEGGATKHVFGRREASGSERPVAGAEEGVMMYWLVLEVHQAADPSVLPSDEEFMAVIKQTVDSYVALLKRRQN